MGKSLYCEREHWITNLHDQWEESSVWNATVAGNAVCHGRNDETQTRIQKTLKS